MTNLLRVREFAELAGVTVKALHHYDRLGLLKPARTAAGYRVYAPADLERLEQIVALRFLGIPLKQMSGLLRRDVGSLESIFRQQREILDDQQRRLDRAIQALADAEASVAAGTGPAVILQKVILTISLQDIDVMRKHFSDAAWPKGREHFDAWPSGEWQALYRDVAAALGTDPAGATAQALADRWIALALGSAAGSSCGRGCIGHGPTASTGRPCSSERLPSSASSRRPGSSTRSCGPGGTRSARLGHARALRRPA